MRALRNHLLLLVVTTGLVLGALPPAALSALAAPLSAQAARERSVTLELSRDAIKVGGHVGVTGRVTNAPKGTQVRVQRGSGGTWKTVGSTETRSADGVFALKNLTAHEPGVFLYRAMVAGPGSTGPVSSAYPWLVVTAENPPTIVSGYVQSGGPVAGSKVLIYSQGRTKPVRTRTTPYGYFLARLPALPKSLLVVATGGTGPIGKFRGTMTARVANPTTQTSFYVNPATTLMAAYMTIHPTATRATAWAKIRGLLGLRKYHNLEWALGGRPSYFDGVKFLRTAKRHGGFDAYVASLLRQIDREGASVDVRRTTRAASAPAARAMRRGDDAAVAGLIGDEAAGYLGVAAQGAGVISAGVAAATFIGALVGWSPNGGPSSGQILDAIDEVQSTLNTIVTQIADLSATMTQGLNRISTAVDQDAFNNATEDLEKAYGSVTQTQLAYAQYVNDQSVIAQCTTPALPGQTTPQVPAVDCAWTDAQGTVQNIAQKTVSTAVSAVGGHLTTYLRFVSGLQPYLGAGGASGDVFHDALLSNSIGRGPALGALVDLILDKSGQLLLPTGTNVMANFTATVLSYQAWAYYLVSSYLNYTNSSVAADAISTTYLGNSYATWPAYDTSTDPPTWATGPPGDGNLHDEMSYLQAILPVPERMAVDMNPGGLMYMSTSNVGLASTYLPSAPADRADCSEVGEFDTGSGDLTPAFGGSASSWDAWVCMTLALPLQSLNAAMTTFAAEQGSYWASVATQGEAPGTYSSGLRTGWSLMSQDGLATMLPRLASLDYVSAQYYFNPGPRWFPGGSDMHDYYATADGQATEYFEDVIDWLKLYFTTLSGAEAICTWAVAQANDNVDECFDMPALVGRPLQSGELYAPLQ